MLLHLDSIGCGRPPPLNSFRAEAIPLSGSSCSLTSSQNFRFLHGFLQNFSDFLTERLDLLPTRPKDFSELIELLILYILYIIDIDIIYIIYY